MKKLLRDNQLDGILRMLDAASELDRPELRDLKKAAEKLPPPLKSVHPHDKHKLLGWLSQEYAAALEANESGADPRGISASLKKLARLSLEMNELVVKLPYSIVAEELNTEVNAAWHDLAKEEWEFQQYGLQQLSPESDESEFSFEQFSEQLAAVSLASQLLASKYDQPRPAHRPPNFLIQDMTATTALCWASLSLLSGSTLSTCMPTGRNGGTRWCVELLASAIQNDWINSSGRPGWQAITIEKEIPKTVKRLIAEALETDGAEPLPSWNTETYDSIVGLYILHRALSPQYAFSDPPLKEPLFREAISSIEKQA